MSGWSLLIMEWMRMKREESTFAKQVNGRLVLSIIVWLIRRRHRHQYIEKDGPPCRSKKKEKRQIKTCEHRNQNISYFFMLAIAIMHLNRINREWWLFTRFRDLIYVFDSSQHHTCAVRTGQSIECELIWVYFSIIKIH